MNDVIELSYTGDLLAHRRCARAWAYEKHAGFNPYEQVQAMEGRLVHHAMEWLTRRYAEQRKHAALSELRAQLEHHFRVLWARGVRTAFESKQATLDRICDNLFPDKRMHPTIKAVVEGARHSEYELRAVRKLVKMGPGGKRKLLLTGVLDLVVQQSDPLEYAYTFEWTDRAKLLGKSSNLVTRARQGDVEIWDYKGSRASTPYVTDYVRQLLTYAHLYHERTAELPARCVLFYINEPVRSKQLLAVEIDRSLLEAATNWTLGQVDELQQTISAFQRDPCSIAGGDRVLAAKPVGKRVSEELGKQCTACGRRFDCGEYLAHLKRRNHPDVDILNVFKN